jgi:mRNA-degrading endonuclease toxin of MazEF toxin-antitoxin module
VIISNDYNNARLDDVLLVPLTSNVTRAGREPTQVIVSMTSEEGKAAGLRLDSVIDCTVIATIPKTLLVNKIGAFPQETMERVDQCLMIAMAIGRPVGGVNPLPGMGTPGQSSPDSPSAEETQGGEPEAKPDDAAKSNDEEEEPPSSFIKKRNLA